MQTATNPQTGEKIMWNGSAWVPATGAAPTPVGPPQSVTLGTPHPPKPPEPKTTYRPLSPEDVKARGLPNGVYQVSSEGKIEKVSDVSDIDPSLSQTIKGLGLDELLGNISSAKKEAKSGYATGLTGSILGAIPGTTARDFRGSIEGIKGGIILEKLQALRDQSKTGASGLGQMSNQEGDRLAASVASLDPSMSEEKLMDSLTQIERHARALQAIANGENPSDPNVANKYGIPPVSLGGEKLSGEQVASELQARVRRGDDPSDTIHWLVSIGRPPTKEQIQQIIAGTGHKNTIVEPPHDPSGGGGSGGLGHMFAVGAGGVAEGVGDLAGLVSNPFIQGVNQLTGSNYNPDMGANVRDALGLPAPQTDQEQFAAAVNNYGTQALSIASAAKLAAAKAAPVLGRTITGALERLGSAPLTDSAAGATGGAASDLTRQAGGGPAMQALAGIGGGIASLPVSGVTNSLLRGTDGSLPSIIGTGAREGVTVNRAMVDPALQQKVTAVGKTMTGGRMMQREMGQVSDQIKGRVDALGNGGQPLEPVNAGETVQNIGQRYIKTSGQEFSRRYDALRKSVGDIKIQPKAAIESVDGILARLNEAPETNSAEIKYLQGLRSDLSKGLSVDASRDIGSKLAADVRNGGLTFGKAEADVLNIRNAVSQDIASGLAATGKRGAAAQFKQLDGAYRERMDFVNGTLKKLLGSRNAPLSPEATAARLKAFAGARGDVAALGKIMAQATPEEQADIAATFANALGKKADGSFSTADLVKHIEAIPQAARSAIFGQEGAKSLQNLADLARSHKRVMGALGGSPTGVANDYRSFLLNMFLGSGAGLLTQSGMKGAAVAAAGVGVKMGRDAINAKLLMSTKITGWLRSAPKTNNPAAINSHFDRLKAIAVREPALAPEIKQLQDMILKTANENTTPAVAASQPDQSN